MHRFNTILFGSESSGKTQLFNRIIERERFTFNEKTNQSRGVDFKLKSFDVNKQLYISDLPGSEQFSRVLPSYYKKAEAALFCVDLSVEFNEEEIRRKIAAFKAHNQTATVLLVGTKAEHPEAQIDAFQQMNLNDVCPQSFIVSAKNNTGVDELLEFLHNLSLEQLRAPWDDAVSHLLKSIETLPTEKQQAIKAELDILSQKLNTFTPHESLDTKAAAINQFTARCDTILSNNKYSNVMKAVLILAAVAVVTVLAALVGFGIGFALGLWSGPGAIISGLVAANTAAVAVVTASVASGAVAGGLSAYGLFKAPPGSAEVKELAKTGLDLNSKGHF